MTIGLSILSNNSKEVKRLIDTYGKYFDKYFVTIGARTKSELHKLQQLDDPKLVLSFHKWNDNFADARNENLKTIDTDYWFWIDSDDEIIHPERIRDLAQYMEDKGMDIMQLNYDYAQDEQGNAISNHVRERLIRAAYEGRWDAPVHETFQGPPAAYEQSEWVSVKHIREKLDVRKSMDRNKKILTEHYKKTGDPRDAQYLGMTAMADGDSKMAVQYFLLHIQSSGSSHDIYRSWCRIAEIEWKDGNYEQALYATDEAIKKEPSFPDAYHIKVMVYTTTEEYDAAIEWLKVALSKPVPETLNVIDPTLYSHRGLAMGAQCYLFSGRPKEAYALYQQVIKVAPKFFEDQKKFDGVDWDEVFTEAYFDTKALDYAKWLLYYTKGNGGKPEKIFESLPARIFNDIRLNPERASMLPKKKWPHKSIVFFCGRGSETWGPDTLDKGMGGSEEAIVNLSRSLADLGWEVVVYNERDEELLSDGVLYKPWTLFNPNDEFDVFVGHRIPAYTRDIKARIRVLDLHDTPVGHASVTSRDIENTDKFFFKSEFQTTYSKKIPKEKVVIVGNGIDRSHFDVSN